MASPFLSELRIFSFSFAPRGWMMCNGQLLPINQNQALFSLLGTTYGGDGRVNFGLPNLQGNVPISQGSGFTLGERGGEQSHTLSISEIPTHAHSFQATNAAANTADPAGNLLGGSLPIYDTVGNNLTTLAPNTLANVGGSQAHLNMQPFLTLNICIALQGIFPSVT